MKKPLPPKSVRRTTLLQVFLVAFLVGLALARTGWAIDWRLALASGLLLPLSFTRSKAAILALAVFGLALGIFRGQVYMEKLLPLKNYLGQSVTVMGEVKDDTLFTNQRQSEFHIEKVRFLPTNQPTAARLTIRGFSNNKVSRGDIISAQGKLYATRGSAQAAIGFAKVTIVGRTSSWLERFRRRFVAGIHSALPEPLSSLGLGFLVGGRTLLPPDLQAQLTATGLTHIVAVSGFNLTILVRFTRRLLAKKSKYLAMATAVGLILAFIGVTGNSPSIARAAVVSLLALAGWYYGRPLKPTVLLLLAGALTAGYRPLYLWSDIGWHLSFLAFIGVLIVAPAISQRLRLKKTAPALVQVLLETVSAQLLTLPLIIYVFGQASVIAPVANLVILPLVPLAMLLTLIAGLAGTFLAALAGWLAWPAYWLLQWMIAMIQKLSSLPMASAQIHFSLVGMLSIYAAIFLLVIILKNGLASKGQRSFAVVE